MQIERTTIYNIPNDLLRYMALNFFDPREALKLSQVCKQWRKISECKIIWKEMGKRISHNLLVPEHTIVPEDKEETLDIKEYKERIRLNAGLIQKEITNVLLTLFPSVARDDEVSILNPYFLDPYQAYIKANLKTSWPMSKETHVHSFMEQKRLHPKVFMLFLVDNLFNTLTNVETYQRDLMNIVNTGEHQKLLDWLETAKICKDMGSNSNNKTNNTHLIFFSLTNAIAGAYIYEYEQNTLQQLELQRNDTVFQYFIDFIDDALKDPLFIEKMEATEHAFRHSGKQQSRAEKENIVNEFKRIIARHRPQPQ